VAFYPVFLDLAGRRCVVLGGGELAGEKVGGLLTAGAEVTVIAEEVTSGISELAAAGRISHRCRGYASGDLEGARLAIVCAQPPAVASAVWEEGRRLGVLVNTVDDVAHCEFIAPSVVRRGDLQIAISTGGRAPALAVRLRQKLERELGEEHARFLEMAGAVRGALAERRPDFAERRELWYRLVDSDVLSLLRRGEEAKALGRFTEILGVSP
jgi:siroheme synthase-like protein